MNDATAKPQSLASALDEVSAWRAEAEQKTRTELAEVDQEIESLQTAMQNLQQQLDALRRFREEVSRRDDRLADEQAGRTYNAIFAALGSQAAALDARAEAVNAAYAERNKALEESLKDPEVAGLMNEYTQFKTLVEPTLAAMPESYRNLMLQHHEKQGRQLQDVLDRQRQTVVNVDAAPLGVEVVFAVDSPAGTPEVLMLVLPVPENVQTDWQKSPENLHTWIAARVVQGVYTACEAAGVSAPRAMYGGHQGLLAIEVEIHGAKDDIGDRVKSAVDTAISTAHELTAAKVQVDARSVQVDNLLPPEDGQEPEHGG
jgi:hypothetical protein